MTVCITNDRLPSVYPCTVLGEHRVTCRDHEGWAERPGLCRGCLPRLADVGHLCRGCYERVMASVAAWPAFREKLDATEGRAVATEGGGTALGFSNLTLVFLTVDECERHRASLHGTTVDVWVQSPEGAADAIQFAHAAARAWDSLPVEHHEPEVRRHRCHECGHLAAWGNTTHQERGATVVTCRNCGAELERIRPDIVRWVGSPTCEHQLHADCDNLTCGCPCHHLGARSRPGGVQALWDADQHTTNPGYRAGWGIKDALTIEPISEEKAA